METPYTPPFDGYAARSRLDSEDDPMEIYLALMVLNLVILALVEC